MEKKLSGFTEFSALWSFPLTLLIIVLILAALDVLFSFLPFKISNDSWLWVCSTLTTSIVASLVTEKLSMDKRKTCVAMLLSAAFSLFFYRDLAAFFQRSLVNSMQSVIPNPFIGMVVYTSFLTLVPSSLIGIILGGVLGSFPFKESLRQKLSPSSESVQDPNLSGYEKFCQKCSQKTPYDSEFCPLCGMKLKMRQAPQIKHCRYCGFHLKHQGQFCSECGMEINMVSIPLIFYSK